MAWPIEKGEAEGKKRQVSPLPVALTRGFQHSRGFPSVRAMVEKLLTGVGDYASSLAICLVEEKMIDFYKFNISHKTTDEHTMAPFLG